MHAGPGWGLKLGYMRDTGLGGRAAVQGGARKLASTPAGNPVERKLYPQQHQPMHPAPHLHPERVVLWRENGRQRCGCCPKHRPPVRHQQAQRRPEDLRGAGWGWGLCEGVGWCVGEWGRVGLGRVRWGGPQMEAGVILLVWLVVQALISAPVQHSKACKQAPCPLPQHRAHPSTPLETPHTPTQTQGSHLLQPPLLPLLRHKQLLPLRRHPRLFFYCCLQPPQCGALREHQAVAAVAQKRHGDLSGEREGGGGERAYWGTGNMVFGTVLRHPQGALISAICSCHTFGTAHPIAAG